MAIREIVELGNPLLRVSSKEVTEPVEAHATLDDLRDTLHEFQRQQGFGRGIAAIQIGVAQRVIYIEIGGEVYELINPELTRMSEEKFRMWDDCFSFPNLMVHLERSKSVALRYQDRNGKWHELEAEDGFAELLQHEVDHLDGVLSIDRAIDRRESFMTRSQYLKTLEKNPLRTL
jgi:peptide deformylase